MVDLGGRRGAGAGEVLPLSRRVALVMAWRSLLATTAVGLLLPADAARARQVALVAASHLAVTGGFSLLAPRVRRGIAIRLFGVGMLLDAVFLQYLHEMLDQVPAIDLAVAANLVLVCLVASFRTGLKIGLWQSLLLLLVARAEQARFLTPMAPVHVGTEHALVAEISLLWLVLITTAVSAAANERELRRRRYDAQLLAGFASGLYATDHPVEVLSRLLQVTVQDLGARRALVCERVGDGLRLLCGEGLATGQPPDWPHPSPLLELPARAEDGVTLALRLDPGRDPWLARLLPGARRLVVVPLEVLPGRAWLLFEHAAGSGSRLERRVVATAVQAATTAVLAYSRAVLLQGMREAATRDGLTGVANRRSFDTALARLVAGWRALGTGFALVLVDVDRFKSINDRFGHPVGDEALKAVARTLSSVAGPMDLVARYGGEEFALLLPGLDVAGASEVAERARLALHEVTEPVPLSASFGVAALPADTAADRADERRAGVPAPRRPRDGVPPDQVSAATLAPAPVAPGSVAPGSVAPGPLALAPISPAAVAPDPAAPDPAAVDVLIAADTALLRAKGEGRDRVCLAG